MYCKLTFYNRQLLIVCCENKKLFDRDPVLPALNFKCENLEELEALSDIARTELSSRLYEDFSLDQINDHYGLESEIKYLDHLIEQKGKDYDNTSLYRSRRAVQDIIKSNNWDYFVTLTFEASSLSNEERLQKSLDRLKYLIKCGRLSGYCLFPELTEKGVLHFHGFVSGLDDLFIDSGCVKVYGYEKPIKWATYNKNHKGEQYEVVYNWSAWEFGFSVCYSVKENYDKLLNYMIKYILKSDYKCFDRLKSRRYFSGGDILRSSPSQVFTTKCSISEFDDYKTYDSIFGKIKYIQKYYTADDLDDLLKKLNLCEV